MSETKRVMIRSYDMTDVSRDTGEPRRIVDVPYVLASDYDRDLAEMRRQRDMAMGELLNIANAKPHEWDVDMRDQFQKWAQSRARHTLDALVSKEPRDG